eukprot:GHUV01012286.1.p1 GENE.GHUV01012286.1~~GHUV01012286.1.p1  ORF type:complete len:302 (+),score=85.48 GHUV01012286.1:538-1443(+)
MSAPQQACRALLACLAKQSCALQQQQQAGSLAMLLKPMTALHRQYAVMPDRQQTYQVLQKSAEEQQQLPKPLQHMQQQQQQQPSHAQHAQAVEKIYRGKWIVPVRFLVRAKVFQLLGGGSIGILLATTNMQEATWWDILALTGLAGGMVAASCCLWYYSRRYVGEMALLLPDRQHVRFSVLDFWGNRENVDVAISQITPPFKGVRPGEMNRIASQLLFPVNVPGDRQYYLSVQAGHILKPQAFFGILKGEYDPLKAQPQSPTQAAASNTHQAAASQSPGEQAVAVNQPETRLRQRVRDALD